MPLAYQMRPQLRKFPFPELGKALVQFFAGHQRQHGIAQKLQLLVIADPVFAVARLLRFLLACLRTMRHRLLDDRAPPEMIAQPLFQRRDFPFFHTWEQLSKCGDSQSEMDPKSKCADSRPRLSSERISHACSNRVSGDALSSSPAPQSVPARCRYSTWSADPVRLALPCRRPNPHGP